MGDVSKVAPIDKLSVALTIFLSILLLGEPADFKVVPAAHWYWSCSGGRGPGLRRCDASAADRRVRDVRRRSPIDIP